VIRMQLGHSSLATNSWGPSSALRGRGTTAKGICGEGYVREIRTEETFSQGLVAALASDIINIYSPWNASVQCVEAPTGPAPATTVRRTVRLTNPDLFAEGWGQLVGQGRRCQLQEALITQYDERARWALEASTTEVAEADRLLAIYGRSTLEAAAATDAVDCARVEQELSQPGP
jgi:hypothetical protein